jgi:hypothetical protein
MLNKVVCSDDETFYSKAFRACENKDQQAFTENANNLYYQIRSIIDDFYKAEPKKEEVFYRIGQKFLHQEDEFLLAAVAFHEILLIRDDGHHNGGSIKVKDPWAITEKEMNKIKQGGTFALISDKK